MKIDYAERAVEEYERAVRERRDRELAERLSRPRSTEEMFVALRAIAGLNRRGRETLVS